MNTETPTPITPSGDRAQPGPRPETRSEVGGLSIRHASATHLGWVRETQEDRVLTRGGRLFMVSDGMGGHAAGEVAAQLCVDELAGLFDVMRTEPEAALEDLANAVQSANAAVYAENVRRKAADEAANSERRTMGSTCTAALVLPSSQLAFAHVGDSRLYRLRAGALSQLTVDHNLSSYERGVLVVHGHILYRAIGTHESLEVDSDIVDLEPGDVLLLCSDGLYDAVSDRAIDATLRLHGPGRAVAELVQMALAAGGPDNIAAIVIGVEGA
jgi:protein phosphatase